MPESSSGLKYVLVIKDDLRGFVHLCPAEAADATSTAAALMSWFTLYDWTRGSLTAGPLQERSSRIVRKMVGAHHHIQWDGRGGQPSSPAEAQGFAERDEVANEWNLVLPLVQGAFNHQPSDRLGGVAPVTAFMGLKAKAPLATLVHPATKEVICTDNLDDARVKHMAQFKIALDQLHREVFTRSDKLRQQARGRGRQENAGQI
ncbi:hypothetical protein H310_14594 [Aphanomyces invadans]|uniref:Integrase catalytic domain-containing protein n=1 Tax=Aphanomyces invadans TaxID=157072 RepID=A0A024TBG3_9STRA|nr:hypothetical protein H310_14594 [Aphanomyces invadans]ETV90702.1 hypothetical protein H310_14594 [Aphanomyces invadans]|eukprot:XP_008880699.1 hypothetical protein H310_14594 [Aphanomyces invadans]